MKLLDFRKKISGFYKDCHPVYSISLKDKNFLLMNLEKEDLYYLNIDSVNFTVPKLKCDSETAELQLSKPHEVAGSYIQQSKISYFFNVADTQILNNMIFLFKLTNELEKLQKTSFLLQNVKDKITQVSNE